MKRLKTYVDKTWLKSHEFALSVYIAWSDDSTDIVDVDTGVVVYSRPTVATALESAVRFARTHGLTIRRVDVLPRGDMSDGPPAGPPLDSWRKHRPDDA